MRARTHCLLALAFATAPTIACTGHTDTPDADAASDIVVADVTDIVAPDAAEDVTPDEPVAPDVVDVPPMPAETEPRAIAPLASATVSSQRPTFHFAKPADVSDVTVEVCAERDCTTIEQSLATTETSIRATTALTPGVHWWRLRDGTRTSAAHWFWVNVRSADIDTSYGSEPDVNGDGLPEILVGANHAGMLAEGRMYVYPGAHGDFVTTASTVIDGTEANGHFAWWLASAGDVNGDGYVDVVVGAPDVGIYQGRVYVFNGSATGLPTTPSTVLQPPESMGNFGAVATSAGDVNGDGYSDIVASAPNTDVSTGSVFVFLGSRAGVQSAPSLILHGPDGRGTAFGAAVAPAGDVNGDGFGDVMVGANGAASGSGRVYIYLGSSTGLGHTPATVLNSPATPGAQFGSFVAGAGDVNGDGYTDVAVGATGTTNGDAYVFLGGASVSTMPHVSLVGPDGPLGGFGWSVSGAGDVNHDGLDDVVLSAVCAPWTNDTDGGYPHCGAGRAYVFHGSQSMIGMTPSLSLDGPEGMEGSFGWSMAGVGDVNGDGVADVVASAYAINQFFGAAYVYPGGAGGLPGMPTGYLRGTAGTSEDFGWCVASRGDLTPMIPLSLGRAALGARSPARFGRGENLAGLRGWMRRTASARNWRSG